MKYVITIFALAFLGIFALSNELYSNSGGATGYTVSGCSCHGASNSATSVTLKNLPSTLTPGQQVQLVLEIVNSTKDYGGYNLRVINSNNQAQSGLGAGTGSRLVGSELTHSSRKSKSGDKVEFPFSFTAPTTPGSYSFQGVGNAVDGTGSTANDQWNSMTSQSFTVVEPSGRVTGTITVDGVGLAGVTVSDGTRSATTAANGTYTITGIPDGTYAISPSLSGYTFTPSQRNVTITGNQITADFTAESSIVSLSGRVTLNGGGFSGVTIRYGMGQEVVTSGDGTYSISNLTRGNTVTVTPSRTGYTFEPSNRQVVLTGNMTNIDFVGTPRTYNLSGNVFLADQTPIEGINVVLKDTEFESVTNENGAFRFEGLNSGKYTIVPSKAGYTFEPAEREVEILASNLTAEPFVASLVLGGIKGQVTLTGTGFPGIRIAYNETDFVETDVQGNFEILDLPSGTYTLTPSFDGLNFAPESIEIEVSGAIVENVDFVASVAGLSISGMVTFEDSGLENARILLNDSQEIFTDANGNFMFDNLMPGEYTLRASKAGFRFEPQVANVTLALSNVNDVMFVGRAVEIPVPMLSLPANAAINQSVNVSLQWEEIAGVTGYQLEVEATDGSMIIEQLVQANSIAELGLDYSKTYTWRVATYNSEMQLGDWSETWTFSTRPNYPLEIVGLLPENGAVNLNPANVELSWAADEYAVSYEVKIAKDESMQLGLETFSGIANNEFTAILDAETTYYWQVRGVGESQAGVWSQISSFTTDIGESVRDREALVNLFQFSAHPTPANSFMTIECNLESISNISIDLMSLDGVRISTLVSESNASGLIRNSFDVSNLASGSYYLIVSINNNRYSYPFVKVN